MAKTITLQPRHVKALLKAYRDRNQMVYPSDYPQLQALQEMLEMVGAKMDPYYPAKPWKQYMREDKKRRQQK